MKPGKRGRGADGKALVVIAAERREGGPGRVRMQRIPNVAADTLTDFVLDHVARGAEVHTVGRLSSNSLAKNRLAALRTSLVASSHCRSCHGVGVEQPLVL